MGAELFHTDRRIQTDRHDAGNSRFLILRTHLRTCYVSVSFCLCAPTNYGIFIVTDCTACGRHCLKQPVVVKQLRNVCSSAGTAASTFADWTLPTCTVYTLTCVQGSFQVYGVYNKLNSDITLSLSLSLYLSLSQDLHCLKAVQHKDYLWEFSNVQVKILMGVKL